MGDFYGGLHKKSGSFAQTSDNRATMQRFDFQYLASSQQSLTFS